MPDASASDPDTVHQATSFTSISGGVNISGAATVGGDLVGRDKITVGYTSEQVSALLTQITSTFQPKPFDGRCPYLGLDYFSEDDADRFFGREALISELVARVKESRFVVIAGPSGSGKSSLARAGLIHTLKQGALPDLQSDRWLYATLTPGRDPIESLALAMSRLAKSPDAGDYVRGHKTEADMLHKFTESLLSDRKDQRAVIFVDQFEEVFTQVSKEDERLAFLNLLTHAATLDHGRVTVLFVLRSDFVSNCATYPQLNALLNQQFIQVGAMQPDELVSAIARPALQVGLRIEPDLVAQIVNDMHDEPGALPLMQFALKDLFDAQQARGGVMALTLNDYLAHGGLRKSLERYADAAFAQLSEPEQQLARSVFSGLIEIGRGTSDTRRTALFDELVPSGADAVTVKAVVQKLADTRLITTDEQGSQDTVTIAHERLIEAWPWLHRLVNENREAIALQNQIAEDAQEWERNQRDASYLYSGARLANAREQLAAKKIVLSGLAHAFVEASVEAEEAERQREEAGRRQELENAQRTAAAQRRAATLLRWVVIVLALGVVGSFIGGFLAVQQRNEANLQRDVAKAQRDEADKQRNAANTQRDEADKQRNFSLARELAAVSMANLDVDPELSLHLALRSISDTYTLQGEDAVRQALLSPPVKLTLHGHSGEVYSVAYDDAGQRLITASADGTARIWDAASGQALMVLRGHTGAVYQAAFSPNSRLAATAGADKTVRIWNVDTGQLMRVVDQHSGAVNSVAFSPDGQRLVTASADKTARVWDIESGRQMYVVTHTAEVRTATFSPHGTFIATGGNDQLIKVWDAATGQLIKSLANDDSIYSINYNVNSIAFSPDEQYVLVDQNYNAVRWNIQSGQIGSEYRGQHSWYVTGVAFSPDGKQVVTTSRDHTVCIWDAESSTAIEVLPGHSGIVYGAAFDPSGDHLATASEDQTVRIWNIAEWRKRILIGYPGFLGRAAYSSDGRRIATTGNDGMIRIWDATSGRELNAWRYTGYLANRLHFSPDDRQIITSSDDGTWRLWDAVTGKELYRSQSSSIVSDARFSRDGTRIITTGRDSLGRIWDAATHQQLVLLKGQGNGIWTAMFSPDGQLAVTSGADDQAWIWNARTGEPLHILSGHSDLVTSAAFDSNGKRIVTASVDGTARIWDVSTGHMLHILKGHTRELTDATFSPDNQYIATASRDHTIILWDAGTGDEIIRLFGHHQDIFSVEFSPDSRYLLTASLDGTTRIYPVRFEDVVALARSLLSPRELTCAERVKYLHEESICPTPTPASQVTPTP
jgi:WD40 repeat protein/energy-coupling factor transporter ATP-binding protein EcfA2